MFTTVMGKIPVNDLWRKFRDARDPRRRTRLRGQLIAKHAHMAKGAAMQLHARLNDPSTNREDLEYAALLFLGEAIDRFDHHPGHSSFKVICALLVTRRLMQAIEKAKQSGVSPFDAALEIYHADAYDMTREDTVNAWDDPKVSGVAGGLNQHEHAILGLHFIERWSIQELSKRFRADDSSVKRTICNAILKFDKETAYA